MGVGGNSWINNRPLRSSGLPNTEGCKIYVMTAGDQMEMCSGYTTLLQYPYLYRKKTDELQSPRENFHLMPYLIIKQSAGQIVSDSKNKCSTYLHYLFKVFFFKGHTFFFFFVYSHFWKAVLEAFLQKLSRGSSSQHGKFYLSLYMLVLTSETVNVGGIRNHHYYKPFC